MSEEKPNHANFIYRPPEYDGPHAVNATLGVRFAQRSVILDPWFIIGGTKWTRTLYRIRHPMVYFPRGVRILYRRIRRLFVEDKIIPCHHTKGSNE